ncbi:hypothetical protein [Bradyrhizobium guangdongense]|uniref:hypothetical protein n=2 Tax=Bradyrhizobium guangdongense TaxID=1325090 RepID=UPI0018899A4E
MINQPAIEPCRQRSSDRADRAQQRPAERREHKGDCAQRIDCEHQRLAVGKTGMVHDTLRQQQQRRIGFLDLDRMLAGDAARDRQQPAREQIWIEDDRGQKRQRKAQARHRQQSELLPPRHWQQIERGQHRTEHQLERHHEAEQRRPCESRDIVSIVALCGAKQKRKCRGREAAAEDREIARGQHPFEADERAEGEKSPERHVAQIVRPADPGQ